MDKLHGLAVATIVSSVALAGVALANDKDRVEETTGGSHHMVTEHKDSKEMERDQHRMVKKHKKAHKDMHNKHRDNDKRDEGKKHKGRTHEHDLDNE